MTKIELFTDGGSNKDRTAASAAIIQVPQSHLRMHLAAFLGEGTNNEAEIFAGLLGFYAINQFKLFNPKLATVEVVWTGDSEYVLKSATQYIKQWQQNGWKTSQRQAVKNVGMWKEYLNLSSTLKIVPNHVRGHTGHPENEACDVVCNWVKSNASSYFLGKSEGIRMLDDDTGRNPWLLLDAREIIQKLRSEQSEQPDTFQALDPIFQRYFSWYKKNASSV